MKILATYLKYRKMGGGAESVTQKLSRKDKIYLVNLDIKKRKQDKT